LAAAALLAAGLGLLATASPAAADVRTGQVSRFYDPPAPSLSPDPADDPANQNLLRSYSVSFDDDAGTITIVGAFDGDPAQAANGLPGVTLGCASGPLTISLPDHDAGDPHGEGVARLAGFEGRVVANAQVSANAVTYSFSHPEFRNRGYECFRDRATGERYHFGGYSPQEKAQREPTYMTVSPFRYSDDLLLRKRPSRFGLMGRSMAESGLFLGVKWSSWGRWSATGAGYAKALHARPTKSGRYVFDKYKVRLRLSRTRLCGDVYEFTRVRISSRWGKRTMRIPNAC
jgi:hypothetical protein